jgi:hypothetical protein
MEIVRDLALIGILLLLFLQVQPFSEPSSPTETGLLSGINQDLAGINSDTDGISNLLTGQQFLDEDFAQEGTLSSLEGKAATESTLRSVEAFSNDSSSVLTSIFDDSTDRAKVTTATRSEHLTDLGQLFIATHVENDISAGDSIYYVVETSNSYPAQTRFDVTGTGAIEMSVYENGSRVGGSQGLIIENAKRNSDNLDGFNSTWYNTTDPGDISSFGEKIETMISDSGSVAGPSTAGAVSRGAKWVFKSNTTYVVEVENIDGNTIDVGLAADFYEQPVIN